MNSSPSFPVLAEELPLDSQNPWPGLTAFTERQQGYFFGRKDESDELFRCVKRERLTVLFGKSGLGKTSLLQAGLFPQLRAASFLPVYIRLSYADDAPTLESQVQAALEAAISSTDLAEVAPPQPSETVWEYLHRRGGNLINYEGGVVTPILVFDQFEEWFTLGARQGFAARLSEDFLPALADLIENRTPQALTEKLTRDRNLARQYDLEASGCRILITLREDYLANLENLRGPMPSLVFVDNRMRLTEMSGRQAYSVVAEPNQELVAGDVAEFIVRFVAGVHADAIDGNVQVGAPLSLEQLEIAPAILSLFCRQINEKRLNQNLPKITRRLVTTQGVTIIDDFYKQSIADMHPEVRRLIEDRLLTKAGYRDNIDLAQAKADLEQAGAKSSYIDDLIRLRLLQVEEHRGVPRLELTHDVLAEPVKRSRDQWDEQQARAKQLEQEREALAQARRAEQEALSRARFLQKVIGAVVFVSLLLTALLAYGLYERSVARANEELEKQALNDKVKLTQDKATAEEANAKAKFEGEKEKEKAELEKVQQHDKDMERTREAENKLNAENNAYLNHCVTAAKDFYKMGGRSPEIKGFFYEIYEHSLMGEDQCFSAAQHAHDVAPQDVDIMDVLTLIPLWAADSARAREDNQTVSGYRDRAVALADSLQGKEGHSVKILLARTYVFAGYELADVDPVKAQADAERGMNIVADLQPNSARHDFDDRDWDRLSQVHMYHGDYLQRLKKDTEAITSYEESFKDEMNAHKTRPSGKYLSAARDRAFRIGDYEKRLGNNDAMMQWYDKAHGLSGQYIDLLLKEPPQIQRDRDLAAAYGDAAQVEEDRNQWPQAVDYRDHAVTVLAALKADAYEGARNNLAFAYRDLAWAEIYAGQVEKGLEDAQKGITMAKEAKSRAALVAVYLDTIKALTTNKSYDQAHKLSDQYIEALLKEPEDVQRDRDLATAYGRAAKAEEARNLWRQAVDYRAHTVMVLAALKADAYEGVRNNLALAYRDLAWAEIYAGQVEKGLEDAQKGIAVAEEIKDHSTLVLVYTDTIKVLTANESYDQAHKLSDQYIETLLKEPQNIQRDRDLATAYGRAADVEETRKQWQQAVDYRVHAVTVLAALKADAYEGARNNLAFAYRDLAWAEIYAGQVEKGLEDAQKGITMAKEAKSRAALVAVYLDTIKALTTNKSYDQAHKLSDQYIEALLKEPQDIQRDRVLATAYGRAADVEEPRKQWQQAVDYRVHAVTVLAGLKADAYEGERKDFAVAYRDLAWAEVYAGQVEKGLEHAQRGIAVAEEIKDHSTLILVYTDTIKALTANKSYDQAHKVSDQYIQALLKEPQSTQRDRDLAEAYDRMARVEEGSNRWPQAVDYRKRQVALLIALKEKHAYDDVLKDLADAYGGLSWMEMEAGRFADGLKDAQSGLAEHPTETWISVNEAHGLLLTGKVTDAKTLYLKIKDYPWGDHTLIVEITDDFQQLCKLGYVRREMAGIAHDLGITKPELIKCLANATNPK